MSRGLGTTQQAILRTLAEHEYSALSVAELAERVGRSPRQVRTAVHALARRGAVVITREGIGWHGAGEYGRLARQPRGGKLPVALTVRKGEPTPYARYQGYGAWRDTEYVRNGMPAYGLLVWLAERRQQWEERRDYA